MLAAAGDRFGDHCLGVPVTGGRSWRRRSCSRRGALEVMVSPRQPRLARSSTAHTSDKHELSPGEPANDLHPAAGLTEGAFDESWSAGCASPWPRWHPAWLLGPLRRSGDAGRRAVAQPVNNPYQTARPLPTYPVDTGSPTHIWPSGAQGRLRPITRREWRQTPPDPSGCARSPNTGGPVIGGRWIPDTPDRLVMGERPRRLAPPCSAIGNGGNRLHSW